MRFSTIGGGDFMHWLFLLLIGYISASDIDPAKDLYANIKDIRHPTQEELIALQNDLLSIDRPILERMPETGHVPREFCFIKPDQKSEYERLTINFPADPKECCIISYASYNERFSLGVKRLVDAIQCSDYRGTLCYRIGGFPNIEGGDLDLAHVPFAFKVAFFKEMERLGYKKILWLDGSILPASEVSLNYIFRLIAKKGFFIQANDHTIARYINEDCVKAFDLSLEEAGEITSCSASIIGLDLTNPKMKRLLDAWYKAARHPFGFFSDRSDQNALSILIHQFGLSEDLIPRKFLGSLEHPKGSLFLMDRPYVKDERETIEVSESPSCHKCDPQPCDR